MFCPERIAVGLLIAIAPFLPFARANAQTTYSDNAAAYTDNYAGLNHGTGFGPFTITIPAAANASPPYSGTFVGDAAASEENAGMPAPDTINTSGKSFGFYANQGAAASVTIRRNFTNSLNKAGDSFRLDFVGGFNDGGTVGVALIDANGNVAALNYSGATGQYSFNGGANFHAFATGVLHLTYTLLSPTSVRLNITGAFTSEQTASVKGPIMGFQFYQTGTNPVTGTPDHNGYVNNLTYTIAAAAK